jgi:tRNA A-37 threonylcarbamoyl transferase component Bud32
MTRAKVITFNYGDSVSTVALWWKAFFLMPFWGLFVFPIIGLLVGWLGAFVSSIGYILLLVACMAYFVDDLLQRKVRIADGVIKHGLQKYKLNELQSLGVHYKRGKISPDRIVFTFLSGRSLELVVNRVSLKSLERVLGHVEQNYAQCQIDPVLRTLVRCQKVARKILVDDADALIIEYKGYRQLVEVSDTYTKVARGWLQLGPAVVVFLTAPMWTAAIGGVYAMGSRSQEQTFEFVWQFVRLISSIHQAAAQGLYSVTETAGNLISNPLVACTSLLMLVWIFGYVVKRGFRPTAARLDREGLELRYAMGNWVITLAKVAWQSVDAASLVKSGTGAESGWKLCLQRVGQSPFYLDLAAILPDDRPRMLRALERFAPQCKVSSELIETMAPKQDRSYTQLWLQSLAANPERNTIQALLPGHRLHESRYKVLRRLGVGGQSTAYLCHDEFENRDVVLKETILPIFADSSVKEQALMRFEHEAKILESLDCDNIVRPLDYFFEDHRCFLVLEHVDGCTLRQLVADKGALAQEQVLALAQQMCDILQYLHGKGIIHRDVTPDNLIVTASGALKLIDFNVAQQAESNRTGTIAGKHAYLPPEQFRGKATFQSDIYALGACLYYLLTGVDPEPITQSSARLKNENVSESIDQVIGSCTALSCDKRAKDIEQVRRQLEKCGETTQADREPQSDSTEGETIISTAAAEREKVLEGVKPKNGS